MKATLFLPKKAFKDGDHVPWVSSGGYPGRSIFTMEGNVPFVGVLAGGSPHGPLLWLSTIWLHVHISEQGPSESHMLLLASDIHS